MREGIQETEVESVRSLERHAFPWIFSLLSAAAVVRADDDLGCLSDEFDDPASIADWQRLHEVEQWYNDQLETYDIDTSQPGRMFTMPYTCTWFQDYRGPMSFKTVSGDFAITAFVEASARDGESIPGVEGLFSLAGLMMRTPRDVTPETWEPGGENYVFLSIGYGVSSPPTFQFEVKTTIDSDSTLVLSESSGGSAALQLARLGEYVICLRQMPGDEWLVHRRYHRPDFPETLQVGLVTYTDWVKVAPFDPFVHNSIVLTPPLPDGVEDPAPEIPYRPDLIAGFEYARYFRPTLPEDLEGVDLTDESLVSDAELLAFLGENANVPGGPVAGDMDCDCHVSSSDVPPFIEALLDSPTFTGCDIDHADMNGDGKIDGDDIAAFVASVTE